MQLFSLVVVLALLFAVAVAEKLDYHTFEPPFTEVDNTGQRQVSKYWRTGGTTVVNNNFIRLTPDRQSKKGSLWSRKALGVPSISTVLKFRISGQGKNFFGDGLALWIVQQSYHSDGNLHGFQEKFVGVGIIFDTFKNTEHLAAHRDVTVLVNDGEKTWEMMTENVQGCNMNVRYHNDRADFSVRDASRAKVVADENSVTVYVDARNNGDWSECVSIKGLDLPRDWVRKAYIGLTATTGQLADNHDVISLYTDSDERGLDFDISVKDKSKFYEANPAASMEERLKSLESTMSDAYDRHEYLDHHMEHELVDANEKIENLLSKVKSREDNSENRIQDLEEIIKKEVDGSISSRLTALENQIKGSVDRRISSVESNVDRKITTKMSASENRPSGRVADDNFEDNEYIVNVNDNNKNNKKAPCDCSNRLGYLSIIVSVGTLAYIVNAVNVAEKKYLFY